MTKEPNRYPHSRTGGLVSIQPDCLSKRNVTILDDWSPLGRHVAVSGGWRQTGAKSATPRSVVPEVTVRVLLPPVGRDAQQRRCGCILCRPVSAGDTISNATRVASDFEGDIVGKVLTTSSLCPRRRGLLPATAGTTGGIAPNY